MAGGGWVALHENISERRQVQEERAQLAARDQRRLWVEQAISSFRARAEAMLKTVIESAAAMHSTANGLLASSAKTWDSAKAALGSSHEASAGTESAAAATTELATSIDEINRQLDYTARAVRTAFTKADNTDTEITALVDAAQKIGDIVKLIQNIAAQTNLLALNATIEAARAGEGGRGFGVVAAEVKSLAVQTAKATEDIARQVAAVQTSTGSVVDAIRSITKQMQEIDTYSSEAAGSVAKQGVATREISESVVGASDGAKAALAVLGQVASDAAATSDSARTVLQSSDAVEAAAGNLREEVNSFLKQVSEQANDPLPLQTLLAG
jgi:methyl-accepting chemotaxis protein